MTSLEVSNVGRYGFMGGKPGVSAAGQQGFIEKWSPTKSPGGISPSSTLPHVHGANCDHAPGTPGGGGVPRTKKPHFLLQILGLSRFTTGGAVAGLTKSSGTVGNPFDLGFRRNCLDFWTKGREVGVEYQNVYSVPDGGFGRRGSSSGGRRRGGYEVLALEENV